MTNDKKALLLKREARILRGHFGADWKEILVKRAEVNGCDIQTCRREAIIDILEPVLGYSILDLKADSEDVGAMRKIQ